MTIGIIGAGMAGLLAANMLQRQEPTIYERQSSLPNNHSAVLRFRSSVVGDVLGIEFRRVRMIKDIVRWENPVADALAYSYKNSGELRSDRSLLNGFVQEDRFIAPENLIERMAKDIDIRYKIEFVTTDNNTDPFISTIPMPVLMKALDYPKRHEVTFTYKDGFNVHGVIADCDAYVSLYFPDPGLPFSRVSITGNRLTIEGSDGLQEDDWKRAIKHLGIAPSRVNIIGRYKQWYNKINPIDDRERKRFMFWTSTTHNIYSLGRFATWRPGLLLDDLVKDIRLIERFIKSGDHYALKQHSEN